MPAAEIEYLVGFEGVAMNVEGGESANYFVNGSFESGVAGCFNRMRDTSYLEKSGWTIDRETAFDGRTSLRGEAGRTLHLSGECMELLPKRGRPWVWSGYFKADRSGVRITVTVQLYSNFLPIRIRRRFIIGTEWTRCIIPITGDPMRGERRIGDWTGPFELFVQIPRTPRVWIDAVQFEPGREPTPWRASESDALPPVDSLKVKAPLPLPEAPAPVAAARTGRIRLLAWNPFSEMRYRAPVTLGVPLPAGEVGGNTRFRLITAAGAELPVQTTWLASRVGDGSAIGVGVDFEADLASGQNEFFLEYGAGVRSSAVLPPQAVTVVDAPDKLWETVFDAAGTPRLGAGVVQAAGLDGRSCVMSVTASAVEKSGPLHRVVRKNGLMFSPRSRRKALIGFEARIHQWRSHEGIEVELTLVNLSAHTPVVLRRAGWSAALPVEVRPATAAQYGDFRSRKFTSEGVRDDSAAVVTGGDGFQIRAEWFDAREYHPSVISVLRQEAGFRIWPEHAAPLLFSPGLSVTRSGCLGFAAAGRLPEPRCRIIAAADSRWLARSGVPFALGEAGRTPFLDSYLDNPASVRHTPETVAANFWFGLFDYGDHTGDGGWNNLESYEDYTTLLRGAHYSNPGLLKSGFDSARHYRDVDINQVNDLAIMHSGNHVIGGHHFGHAWTQGVMLHYLLTGDFRSREVALRNQTAIRNLPVSSPKIDGDRRLGYWLLTLADGVRMLGCRENVERFRRQVEYMEKALKRPVSQAETLMQRTTRLRENSGFYWANSGLCPFANFYGCEGLFAMRPVIGRELDPVIRRELETLTDPEIYRTHLEETWPELPPERTMPLIACDYIGGRGSYYYPVLANYAAFSGERRWQELAIRSAYARILEGNTLNAEADILMMTALNALPAGFDEAAVVAEVRQLMLDAAAPELLNGDFSIRRDYAEMMTPRRPDARRMEWLPEACFYPRFWRINDNKEYTATEFMRYRPELYNLIPGGIELLFSKNRWYAHQIQLYSASVRGTAGRWRFRGEFRADGLDSADITVFASDFATVRRGMRVSLLGSPELRMEPLGPVPGGFRNFSAAIGSAGADGFAPVELNFELPGPAILRFDLCGGLDLSRRGAGKLAFRSLECRPLA